MKPRILFLITLLCAAIAGVQIVHAATITVMNTNDSGAGSLRQALADANDGDTIDFSLTYPATITLTSDQLTVDKNVIISGPGAANLTVSGNHARRVFYINSGKTVTISGLTITNGTAFGGGGGGIFNDHATLTINNSTISGSSAEFSNGGGIDNNHATLTINNSTISGNSAASRGGSGGGIQNDGSSPVSATLTINNSTISGNSADFGAGITNQSSQAGSATLTITNSTISGNSASTWGGGIFNVAVNFNETALLTIKNSTISGNSAGTDGGGIFNRGAFTTLTIGDTILNASSGANISSEATVHSLGYNLSSDDASAFLNQTGDQNSTDPMLGPLQDNGGPTFTHSLSTGSPATNMGDPSFTPPPNYDQRGPGFDRVVIGRIDIGAFEVQTIICPQGQGYWKNHPDAWPVPSLMLGSQTYTKMELLNILNNPGGGDASVILAVQLIAARLNIANGSDGTPVTSMIADANAVLSLYSGKLPYKVKSNTTNGQRMVNDGAILESFNKGMLTPGCSQ